MTHQELVELAGKWLKKHTQNILIPNCGTVITEMNSATLTGEIPDVIGWCSWCSVLIEVKVSRKDFLRDKNKNFKKSLDLGMGEYKYYICPKGLIKESDLPENWGLIWVDSNKNIMIKKKSDKHNANLNSERSLLLSLIRRYKIK